MKIDPRGPRFGAAITTVVLIIALILGPVWGLIPLAIQGVAFFCGAVLGLQYQPWGWLYRQFVRPRLAPPAALEDPRPPRFAQSVGLAFAAVGLLGGLLGLGWLFYLATAFALGAAVLNAVFDFCLGCEMYLLILRARGRTLEPVAAAQER